MSKTVRFLKKDGTPYKNQGCHPFEQKMVYAVHMANRKEKPKQQDFKIEFKNNQAPNGLYRAKEYRRDADRKMFVTMNEVATGNDHTFEWSIDQLTVIPQRAAPGEGKKMKSSSAKKKKETVEEVIVSSETTTASSEEIFSSSSDDTESGGDDEKDQNEGIEVTAPAFDNNVSSSKEVAQEKAAEANQTDSAIEEQFAQMFGEIN